MVLARHVSVHHKYMFEAAAAENYALKCQWLGLFNSIANVVPNGVDDIATHIICIVTEIMESEGCSKEIRYVSTWVHHLHKQYINPCLQRDVLARVLPLPALAVDGTEGVQTVLGSRCSIR